uniref:Ig-like domain-containing protein n=1 Tax=Rhabditophanes sp. KR3021 TaxID=114890 RepID=A0AC35U418_9BILA
MLLKIIIRFVLCFNFIYIPNKCFAKKRLELKELESKLNDAEKYNKNLYPNEDLEIPTNIVIQMYIEGMSSFRAATMDFQVDIYFQQLWVDKRLKHSGSKRILIKDKHTFAMIWTPGLYFANAKEAAFHDVTDPNFLVWIYPNGTVFYDTRISLNVICMQNLSRYPHDTQSCKLRILSYAYDNNQLVIEWKDDSKAIDVNKDIRMIDMTLRTIRPSITNDSYASGVWSCARAEFIVDRELMHHLLQTYLPTSLIVVISWFSFWLDIDSVQAKVSLNITTLLALVTQNQAARMSLPHDSADVKAIDIWMGALMTFLFSGMIEFTLVNYYNRRTKRKREKSKNDYDACCGNSNVISNCRHNGLSKKYEDDISSKSSLFPRSHNCILRRDIE